VISIAGNFLSLQSNPHSKRCCKYLLVNWHLPPLAGHPLCCECCVCDAMTAASYSGGGVGCCWHQESFSINNKTQPTLAEMQPINISVYRDLSDCVVACWQASGFSSPSIKFPLVLILNTKKKKKRLCSQMSSLSPKSVDDMLVYIMQKNDLNNRLYIFQRTITIQNFRGLHEKALRLLLLQMFEEPPCWYCWWQETEKHECAVTSHDLTLT
jgi:hypothetical protein